MGKGRETMSVTNQVTTHVFVLRDVNPQVPIAAEFHNLQHGFLHVDRLVVAVVCCSLINADIYTAHVHGQRYKHMSALVVQGATHHKQAARLR